MPVLRNCALIRELTEGYEDERADILIRDDRIEAIGRPGSDFSRYEDAREVDMGGRYVLPGFIDLHVHIDVNAPTNVLADNAVKPPLRVLRAHSNAMAALRAGFTTLRDAGCRAHVDIALRDAIKEGTCSGPRMLVSGLIITPPERGNDFFGDLYLEANGPYEMRNAARRQLAAGADHVKYMGTGAIMNPGGDPGAAICSEDEIRALVEVARDHGTYVMGHNHGTEGIKRAIRCGVRTIEHSSLVDDEAIQMLKSEESYMICNLVTKGEIMKYSNASNNPHMRASQSKIVEQSKKCIMHAYREGLKIGFGTDMGETFCPHGKNGLEFVYRAELGMAPLDILRQATIYSAVIARIDNMVGTIKEGKIADLVILNGDPRKDISIAYGGVQQIYCRGRLVE